MSSQQTVWILSVIEEASAGVDYTSRHGARCPSCGKRAKVISTRPWEDTFRIRYHRCYAPGCVLAAHEKNIKSVEVEQ